jgi:CheY-specific phosphatase CheX
MTEPAPPASVLKPVRVEPASILPREAWHGVLTETAIEVFSVMVGVNVTLADGKTQGAKHVTGIVGIGGAIRANFILQCSRSAAVKLAAQMLGIDANTPDSQKAAFDALGEICNIVAGYFKAKVGLGDACMLSVPTIITGQDYRFHSSAYDRMELALIYEGEILSASLEVAQ